MISTHILDAVNKKARKAEAAQTVVLYEDASVPFGPGKVVSRQMTSLNRETFTLKTRLEEVPSNGADASVRWIVEFKDKFGQVINPEAEYVREVKEVGTPATVLYEKIPGLDWAPKAETELVEAEDGTVEEVAVVKTGRGRPEGPMNNLKAKNIFRNTVNATIEYDDKKLEAAMEFLLEDGDEKFVEKYLEKVWAMK